MKPWVALLDEDEEDYVFWQHGFVSWATHLDVRWFGSPHSFLSAASLSQSKPSALLLDGVVPRQEDLHWLSTLLLHPSCEQACIIMLSEEFDALKHAAYLRLGATDHLLKPSNLEDMHVAILRVSDHIATRAGK
ncbi:response regulator [Spirosoma sp. HMF4905]|uniref:Response regulator n=1 Tax=Spirosoma arboris TaxID=2682092 RepID=A0A7K1S4E2_9BACT|nr:response regulator [Spirosoma arboris]MVM28438.1 response regulator [Spirosoma arboris]